MKRSSAGTYKTYAQASKRQKQYTKKPAAQRKGYGSVPRARGAAVTGEMKYFDCDAALSFAATTTTWVAGTALDPSTTINLGAGPVATPLCLFAPTVGAGLNQRIGRKVKVLKIKVHGQLNVSAQSAQAAADAAARIRLMLVQDCQTNAAQMTGAQLMNDSVTGPNQTICSFQNPNNFGRFKVLKDKSWNISNLNLTGSPTAGDVIQASWTIPFKWVINFKTPVVVNFNATNGGTVADIIDHSFHIIGAANSIAYAPVLNYYTRVAYKE